MREALGKGVNIMADISAAHDHLSALKAKRKEIDAKLAGKGIGSDESRLRRRLIAQIDAEMAAAKFDIVQLGDAHAEAMKQVATYEQQIRAEGIKRNPILRALMSAIEALFGKSAPKEEEQGAQASAEDTSDDAESVDEASVEMLPDDEEPSAAAQGDEEPSDEEPEDDAAAARAAGVRPDLIERFSQQGAESEDESPRADLPKPTGEDDDGIVDVNAETKRRAIEAGVSPEVLAGLEAKQDARASAERERAKRRDALDTLRRLGDSMDDAEAPPKDVQPDAGEWDRDLAEKRAKVRETEERAANLTPSQERALERRRSMVAARATRTQSGTREKERAPEAEKTKVERSARMAKSEAFARVLYLAPRVDRMLKSATAPRLVVQRRAPNFNLISLGA